MEKTGKIVLQWLYSPSDFFEEKITVLLLGYDCLIENGNIMVSMDLEEYESCPSIQSQVGKILLSYFKGANLTIQKPFALLEAECQISYPDGRKGYILHAEAGIYTLSMGTMDLAVYDANGNIKIDTKQARLSKTKRYGELATKYRSSDPVVETLLSSLEKSRSNPNTVLVHLYEIRDTLSTRFGSKKSALQKLGISKEKWNELGRFADYEPFNQGRHSGQHVGALRDASESELKKARDIAIEMVIGYMDYLEKESSKPR